MSWSIETVAVGLYGRAAVAAQAVMDYGRAVRQSFCDGLDLGPGTSAASETAADSPAADSDIPPSPVAGHPVREDDLAAFITQVLRDGEITVRQFMASADERARLAADLIAAGLLNEFHVTPK